MKRMGEIGYRDSLREVIGSISLVDISEKSTHETSPIVVVWISHSGKLMLETWITNIVTR